MKDRLAGSGQVSKDAVHRRGQRVLRMVAELHKQGYQRLRVFPSISGSGMYWRAVIGPKAWFLQRHGAIVADRCYERCAVYTTGAENGYFGWKDAAADDARKLALKFVSRFPELVRLGRGRDWEYVGWYTEMLGWAEAGHFPFIFAPHYEPTSRFVPIDDYLSDSPLPLPPPGDWEDEDISGR